MRNASSPLDLADAAAGHAAPQLDGIAEVAKVEQQIGSGIAEVAKPRKTRLHKSQRANLSRSQWKSVVKAGHASPARFDGNAATSSTDHASPTLIDGIDGDQASAPLGWHPSPLFDGLAEVADLASPPVFDEIANASSPTAPASPALFASQASPQLFDIYDASDGIAEVSKREHVPGLYDANTAGHASPAQVIYSNEYISIKDLMELTRYKLDGNAEMAKLRDETTEMARLRAECSHFEETAEEAKLLADESRLSETAEMAKLRAEFTYLEENAEEAKLLAGLLRFSQQEVRDEIAEVASLRTEFSYLEEDAEQAKLLAAEGLLRETAEVAKLRADFTYLEEGAEEAKLRAGLQSDELAAQQAHFEGIAEHQAAEIAKLRAEGLTLRNDRDKIFSSVDAEIAEVAKLRYERRLMHFELEMQQHQTSTTL